MDRKKELGKLESLMNNMIGGKWNVSKTGEYFADITLDFSTTGEYTNEIGKSVIGTVEESLVLHINYPDGDIEYWNTVNR